jgi:uncharacterized membrane protein YhaH (DUF805 family)
MLPREGRSESVRPSRNPYRAPTSSGMPRELSDDMSGGLLWLFFSFRGRIGRLQFWMGGLSALVLSGLSMAAGVSAIGIGIEHQSYFASSSEPAMLVYAVMLAYALTLAPVFWISLAITAKRWHDRGKSGAWVFLSFVPFLGALWTLIECGCLRGTEGENEYGQDPTDTLGPLG